MFDVVVWLMLVVSVFMIIIVLVQRSKGGGLNQSFASQTQIMGVRKSTDFVEKATWTLAGLLLFFSLAAVAVFPSFYAQEDNSLDQLLENKMNNQTQQAPSFDAQAPAEIDAEALQAPAADEAPAQAEPAEAPEK